MQPPTYQQGSAPVFQPVFLQRPQGPVQAGQAAVQVTSASPQFQPSTFHSSSIPPLPAQPASAPPPLLSQSALLPQQSSRKSLDLALRTEGVTDSTHVDNPSGQRPTSLDSPAFSDSPLFSERDSLNGSVLNGMDSLTPVQREGSSSNGGDNSHRSSKDSSRFSSASMSGNFSSSLTDDLSTKVLAEMTEPDKLSLILRLKAELAAAQRGQQESANRATILSSQNAALQSQLLIAGGRERDAQRKLEQLEDQIKASDSKLEMMLDVRESWSKMRKDKDEKDRQLEGMATQLREAEKALSQMMSTPKAEENGEEESVKVPPSPTAKHAMEEVQRRLRSKDAEIEECREQIKALREELAEQDVPGTERRTALEVENRRLRERVKIVEEAIRAMRDEAKEHVLSIQASDIKFHSQLGSGSFAEVHRALWHVPCAVKKLKESVRSNRYEVNKFQKEAYLLRSLLHPGVLRVFGFCKADYFLVTEVVTGGSLNEIIHSSQNKPTQRQALEYTAQVADILRYLHLCNVVHRDIKPDNLLLDSVGTLKLADFGLACEKKGTYIHSRSNLAGTPRYMAPESYRDEKCTERIDIYALGMILWEMLTAKLPWDGSNFQDVRHAVANAGERPPIPPELPNAVKVLLEGLWHAEPQSRPSAAEALAKLDKMGVRSKFIVLREQRNKEEKLRRAAEKAAAEKEVVRAAMRAESQSAAPASSGTAAKAADKVTLASC